MSRLNAARQSTTGYGTCWYDETRTLAAASPTPDALRLSDGSLLSTRGAIRCAMAKNGRWVAQDPQGIYGSWGTIDGAAIEGGPSPVDADLIGPDGSLIYKAQYFSYGPWNLAFDENRAHDRPLIAGDGWCFQNLGGGNAAWLEGTKFRSNCGLACDRSMYLMRIVAGHLLYQDETHGCLVLDGRVIAPAGDYYRPDFAVLPDGSFFVVWSPREGEDTVESLPLTPADFAALPTVEALDVTTIAFTFTHSVLVAPFKGTGSGAPDLFTLGDYSEDLSPAIPSGRRLLLGHDAETDWTLPDTLRPYDVPLIELYRDPAETLEQSAARWMRQASALLAQWSHVCGVIPMFYDQFRWTVPQVLDGLSYLSMIVNLSPRLQLIAPFAYDRANGITAHPELMTAFKALLAEQTRVGAAVLPPVVEAPPPPLTPPPTPQPPKLRPPRRPNLPATVTQLSSGGSPMTFKCTTTDANTGTPIAGINLVAYCPETAQCWRRTSDGDGYSDVAIERPGAGAVNLDLVVQADGYQTWSQSFKLTSTDQEVAIPLTPFV